MLSGEFMKWNAIGIKTETDIRTEQKGEGNAGWFMSKDINGSIPTT